MKARWPPEIAAELRPDELQRLHEYHRDEREALEPILRRDDRLVEATRRRRLAAVKSLLTFVVKSSRRLAFN